MPVLTPILLTDEDAKLFLEFQKHYELFKIMEEKKVFEIGFGKCTLNFAYNILQNVVVEQIVYKRP